MAGNFVEDPLTKVGLIPFQNATDVARIAGLWNVATRVHFAKFLVLNEGYFDGSLVNAKIPRHNPLLVSAEQLPRLTIDFVDRSSVGLRLITQANWPVECYVASRATMPTSLKEHANALDVPGVYLLVGPPKLSTDAIAEREARLYVGQADSVADRLDSHLKNENKKWWRTAVVLSRRKDPLNLSQIKYLESRLCALASTASVSELMNNNAPRLPTVSNADRNDAEDFLQKALIILGALGWGFFEAPASPETPSISSTMPEVPSNLKPLLTELKAAMTAVDYPKAIWYWTRSDFRAKVVSQPNSDNFRVFARIKLAKRWFRVELKDVGQVKLNTTADLDEGVRKKIEKAYQTAEKYLQRGK